MVPRPSIPLLSWVSQAYLTVILAEKYTHCNSKFGERSETICDNNLIWRITTILCANKYKRRGDEYIYYSTKVQRSEKISEHGKGGRGDMFGRNVETLP